MNSCSSIILILLYLITFLGIVDVERILGGPSCQEIIVAGLQEMFK